MSTFNKHASFPAGPVHAPADFIIAGRPFGASAAFRTSAGEYPDFMTLSSAGRSVRMLPCDGLSSAGAEYEIYYGELPADCVNPGVFEYSIECGGFSASYSVKSVSLSELPSEPPLILTEIYARPRGRMIGQYFELMNPGDAPVDLYGYEAAVFQEPPSPEGKEVFRMPLSDEPGRDILAPGETAAIWGINGKHFAKDGRDWLTPADFFDDYNDGYGREERTFTPEDGRVVPVSLFTSDPASGKRVPLPGAAELPFKFDPSCFCILPRGGKGSDAVYSALYNGVPGEMDTPVWHSSHWRTDIFRPDVGICVSHRDEPTPGFPGRGQAKHDPSAVLPAIIPVSPEKCVYIGDGAVDVVFGVAAPAGTEKTLIANVAVFSDGKETEKLEAFQGDDGLYHAKLPLETVEKSRVIGYSLSVFDGTRTAVFPASGLIEIPVFDNAGPRLLSSLPSPGYCFDARDKVKIRASYYDISGIDVPSCRLVLDGKDRSSAAEWTGSGVSLETRLAPGEHLLTLILCDRLSNRSSYTVSFSASDMKNLSVYVGEVHAHTSDSDGTGSAEDAVLYARDVGGVDFFAVTEHSHYLSEKRYRAQIENADRYDEPGKFACLYGWEMTWNNKNGYWGHMNVLGCRDFVQSIDDNGMHDLLRWLKVRPEAVAMFNHPGYNWGNFDEFANRSETADRSVRLSEIKGPAYDYEYMHLLAKGWHASPVTSEDNHAPNWTTATNMTGCVLAPALTRENILDAFRNNRTYTSSDRTMKIFYRVNGEWLGSRLDNPDRLDFDIRVTTENRRGISLVEIVAEDGIVVASKNAGALRSFEWKPRLAPDYDYYYLRITGPNQYCVTSPVWIENREAPALSALGCYPSTDPVDNSAVSVTVGCPGDLPLKDVRVAFYLSPQSQLRIGETEPFRVLHCGKIKPGEGMRFLTLLPEIPGMRRVTVQASALCGSVRKISTAFVLRSPLSVTEVLPDSSPLEKDGTVFDDPFPYVEITNTSSGDVSLNGGRIALSTDTGKPAKPDRILSTDGITVPARSSVVVWDRRSPELSAADFNARYGVSLTEGVDLFPSQVRITDNVKAGRRIELYAEGDLMSRVHWNYCDTDRIFPEPDQAVRFVYNPNMTLTSGFAGFAEPAPGRFPEDRVPPVRTVSLSRNE
ncbi:MAG: CehA/McbA family metallohydrolase, partial [Clostridia bacterium]|nr:CehA/McbA family metallohydrolase [Clostridia bacterium]